MSEPVTVKVPDALFHSPPPSAEAVLPLTSVPVTSTLPAPVRCTAPPLPGAAPAVLSLSEERSTRVVPTLASIAPPARWASLPVTSLCTTLRVPWLLKTPPPEPAAPGAELPVTVLPRTVRSPISL